MKTNVLLGAAILFLLVSCSVTTTLPSGMYLQNANIMEKPLYKGENESMIRVSGGYSYFETEPVETQAYPSFEIYEFESEIHSGFAELVYGSSRENFSYAFGLTGRYGTFKAKSNSPFLRSQDLDFTSFGLGGKANISYDINNENVNLRLLQFQVGLSRDFGDYSTIREDWDRLSIFDEVHPEDALIWDISLSTIVRFKIKEVIRARAGGGIGYSIVTDAFENQALFQVEAGLGYKAFDITVSSVSTLSLESTNASLYKVALGYRIPLKGKI